MNLEQYDDSFILLSDDDDSSTGTDVDNLNHLNALDGDYIGDMLNEEKEDNTTRVYFQNLNGLKWDKHGGIWPMICQSMAAIHADVACFSEVNLFAFVDDKFDISTGLPPQRRFPWKRGEAKSTPLLTTRLRGPRPVPDLFTSSGLRRLRAVALAALHEGLFAAWGVRDFS